MTIEAAKATQDILPASLPPRGLNRVRAAAYVGVSASKFDQMVADRRMPPPKHIDGRRVWDRLELDEAFSALPNGEEDNLNPWDGPQIDESTDA